MRRKEKAIRLAVFVILNQDSFTMERERYVNIQDVAEFLNVKRSTVYKWIQEGFIPHYKLKGAIRFKLSEIENWMKRRRVKGRETYRLEINL